MSRENFMRWLGKHNADEMLCELLMEDLTREQFRAIWTTYCILTNLEPDTLEYDNKLKDIYDYYWCFGVEDLEDKYYYNEEEIIDRDYDRYDLYMGALLS